MYFVSPKSRHEIHYCNEIQKESEFDKFGMSKRQSDA